MKEIIKNQTIYYESINVPENISVLEYLRESEHSFNLRYVSFDTFAKLKSAKGIIYLKDRKLLAGCSDIKGNHFKSSGGLKVSDPNKNIVGSFIIQNDRVIYDARCPFYEERDSFVYTNGREFYTTMSMKEILFEELEIKRQYLIYLGNRLENKRFVNDFEEVSRKEFLEYITDKENGRLILKTMIKYY